MLTETTGPPLAPAGWGGQESPGHTRAAGSGGHTGRISVAGFPWRFGVDGEAEKGACSSLESRQLQGLGWRLEPGVPLAWGGERGVGGGGSGRAAPGAEEHALQSKGAQPQAFVPRCRNGVTDVSRGPPRSLSGAHSVPTQAGGRGRQCPFCTYGNA